MYIAPKTSPQAPEGTHTGILYSIIDLGSHMNPMANRMQRKVRLTFELSEELMDDGRPFSIGKEFTMSVDRKAKLYEYIRSWKGIDAAEGLDMDALLGEPANISIKHETGQTGKTYAAITAITPLKKNEVAPNPINPLVLFDLDKFNPEVYASLPEFVRTKVAESPEYEKAAVKAEESF